ncbi:AraC-type DNA-binding protein [Mucilaginibacter sp. OK268]|nr:AraC-type DNA-binding protein [Mucilaginibacter sp. OK268]
MAGKMLSMKSRKDDIPRYDLDQFKHIHREDTPSTFGYSNLEKLARIPGFEMYSSEGLIGAVGPLKSDFYRVSVTVQGTLDMQIGLDHYKHQPRTISLTYPNQIFAKNNISPDAFGYYMLFSSDFLNSIIPSVKIGEEFPFYDVSGTPLFRLSESEMDNIIQLLFRINDELRNQDTGRQKAIQMYLYLILLEAKRSYERQQLHIGAEQQDSSAMVSRFRKLVGMHYLTKRQVTDYAELLAVSPNHLNRVVKTVTAKTASDTIKDMLLIEAKSLLKYTDQTVAEIAYKLDFSDPASFNRFFKAGTQETPMLYRTKHD